MLWQCLLLAGITYVALESDEVDELNEMVGNMHLHESFAFLARELDVEEAKTPEDIYKSHLAEDGGFRRKSSAAATGQQVESARANLVRLCLSNRDLLSTLLIFLCFSAVINPSYMSTHNNKLQPYPAES